MGEQSGLLRSGAADVAFLHGRNPDLRGCDSEELLVEPQVVVLAPNHRLAGRTVVTRADLCGEPEVPEHGTQTRDPGYLLQLIALGRAVAMVGASAGQQLRRDLVCVPVSDAEPTPMLIAWPEHSRSPEVAAFVRTAGTVASRHGQLLGYTSQASKVN